jgi:hypothetical protein
VLNDLGQQSSMKTSQLEDLGRKANGLAIVFSVFNELRGSMTLHLHNYDRWAAKLKNNSIIKFHRKHLETANLELELMIAQGRDALEAAAAAMSLAQERRQLRIEALLAAAGVALALPHLLDYEATLALLTWVHGLLSGPLGLDTTHTEFGRITVFWVQIAIVLPFAVLTYVLVKGSLSKRLNPSRWM